MEREIPIEHDAQLEQLVSEAEQGESIVLTRDGVPVATIVAARPTEQHAARQAMARLLSRELRLDGLELGELRKAGRKP